MASFRTGALGSPWSKEVVGSTAMDPGDAEYEDGPKVGPGKFAKRVTAEVSRSNGGNGRKSDDD